MISQTRQRFAMGGMVAVAILAIALAAAYQDDDKLDQARIVGGNSPTTPATGSGAGAADGPGSTAPSPVGAIEGFLPKSGEASACSEPVGVDLAPGYGAKLTINGIVVPPEKMNVNLDEIGAVSEVITASRSLGHYSFKPDDNCPNGSLLRPVNNVLEICVYRLSDATQACTVNTEHIFDSL